MTSKSIVIVTERHLFPVNAGMRARIVGLIQSFRALGFQVVLVGRRPSSIGSTFRTRWLVDRFIPVDARPFAGGSPSQYDCSPFRTPLQASVRRFSPVEVVAEYVWMAPCLEVVPDGVVRFVDTHDLMHVRRDLAGRISNPWVECAADEERRLLEFADTVIAIQTQELEQFRKLVPTRRVICVPHYVPVQPQRTRGERPIVAVIGSDNPCNVEGLRAFVADAWPVVLQEHPGAELRVFGELARSAPRAASVSAVGYVKNLRALYGRAAVVVNPIRIGTGLKIKTVEALAHGKALVTTSCGADGLQEGAGRAFVVDDDMKQFGRSVANLLRDAPARHRLESAALIFADSHFRRERVFAEFLQEIRSVSPAQSRPERAQVAESPTFLTR